MILFVRLRSVLRGAKEVAETEYEVELAVLVVNGLDLREELSYGSYCRSNRKPYGLSVRVKSLSENNLHLRYGHGERSQKFGARVLL